MMINSQQYQEQLEPRLDKMENRLQEVERILQERERRYDYVYGRNQELESMANPYSPDGDANCNYSTLHN